MERVRLGTTALGVRGDVGLSTLPGGAKFADALHIPRQAGNRRRDVPHDPIAFHFRPFRKMIHHERKTLCAGRSPFPFEWQGRARAVSSIFLGQGSVVLDRRTSELENAALYRIDGIRCHGERVRIVHRSRISTITRRTSALASPSTAPSCAAALVATTTTTSPLPGFKGFRGLPSAGVDELKGDIAVVEDLVIHKAVASVLGVFEAIARFKIASETSDFSASNRSRVGSHSLGAGLRIDLTSNLVNFAPKPAHEVGVGFGGMVMIISVLVGVAAHPIQLAKGRAVRLGESENWIAV